MGRDEQEEEEATPVQFFLKIDAAIDGGGDGDECTLIIAGRLVQFDCLFLDLLPYSEVRERETAQNGNAL